MTSEEIVQRLLDFVSETGRLPKSDEPGHKELISAAVETFGSLPNALRVAGLLTGDPEITFRQRTPLPRGQKAKLRRSFPTYPPDYFLDLLNLKRPHFQGRPTLAGVPTWWERRANMQYMCSACRRSVEKGERYIGRKTLNPGKRGIYGYRGTYSTEYYHVVCLLKHEQVQIKADIEKANSEIVSLNAEIVQYQETVSVKKNSIEECRCKVRQVKGDYELAQGVRKVGKWLKSSYTSWVQNMEISRLEREITRIENGEIPERYGRIANLSAKSQSLKRRLNEISARVGELVSIQRP